MKLTPKQILEFEERMKEKVEQLTDGQLKRFLGNRPVTFQEMKMHYKTSNTGGGILEALAQVKEVEEDLMTEENLLNTFDAIRKGRIHATLMLSSSMGRGKFIELMKAWLGNELNIETHINEGKHNVIWLVNEGRMLPYILFDNFVYELVTEDYSLDTLNEIRHEENTDIVDLTYYKAVFFNKNWYERSKSLNSGTLNYKLVK